MRKYKHSGPVLQSYFLSTLHVGPTSKTDITLNGSSLPPPLPRASLSLSFLFFNYFIFFYFKILYWFCHTLTWIHHRCTAAVKRAPFYCCSVIQSYLNVCDPMNYHTPGFPVLHYLPELQTHVHWVSDANQPSHPLSSPSPPAFNLSQHQGLFFIHLFTLGGQSIGASASASAHP